MMKTEQAGPQVPLSTMLSQHREERPPLSPHLLYRLSQLLRRQLVCPLSVTVYDDVFTSSFGIWDELNSVLAC